MFTSDDICVIIDYGMMKEMRKINQGDERYYRQSNEVPKPVRWYGSNFVFYIYLLFFYLRFLPPLTVREDVFSVLGALRWYRMAVEAHYPSPVFTHKTDVC